MKKILLAIAVLVGVFATTSCQKEELQNGSEESVLQFSASIEPGASTKTTVEKVTSPSVAYKTKWENTDCIKIEGGTYQATPNSTDATKAAFTKTSGANPTATPYKAYYPASMSDGTTATLPASYAYAEGKFNMPMYAESTNNKLLFKNLCGVLAITVPSTEISTVSSITVVSDKQMNGAFTANSDGVLTFTTGELTDDDKKVTMTFSPAKTIESSETFYIPVPAGTHNPLTITVSDGTNSKNMVTKKSDGVVVEKNIVYPIEFADNQPIVLGPFSVDGTSTPKKVYFSPGNLWYGIKSPEIAANWHFEDKQYNYSIIYNGEQQRYEWNPEHVCHFYWTKTAATSYAEEYNDGECSESDKFFADGSDADHKLTVDGTSGWYTLSSAEWTYLISTRTVNSGTGEGKSYQRATVNGVYGLILYPDGYNSQTGALTYTSAEWSTMESAGCVFLPAAGYRYGSGVIDAGVGGLGGYYWSSTCYDEDEAYQLFFSADEVEVDWSDLRNDGFFVRLARE